MPTGRETVLNKALSGTELREIIRADVEKLLDGEGLLSHYVAYGRISYDVAIRLHLDNPMRPESEIHISSRISVDHPALEPPPLTSPSEESMVSAKTLTRDIKSPNEERLRHGLTIPVETHGQDGTTQIEQVKYPPQPELGDGEMTITDTTKAAREAWKLPSPTP